MPPQPLASNAPTANCKRVTQNPTRAAQPSRVIFDPWNTSSKGHQHAENRLSGSTGWRDSRTIKLREQFADTKGGGGRRVADTVGAGAAPTAAAAAVTTSGNGTSKEGERRSIAKSEVASFWTQGRSQGGEDARPAKRRRTDTTPAAYRIHGSNEADRPRSEAREADQVHNDDEGRDDRGNHPVHPATPATTIATTTSETKKRLFRGLTFYINGSTYPLISDHKLKRLIAAHGGGVAVALLRRKVTHVILGLTSPAARAKEATNAGLDTGAGGGLASSKIQKEIATVAGAGVRFVSVEWVLACLEQGRRVPEAGFATGVAVAGRGQRSVLGMMGGAGKSA